MAISDVVICKVVIPGEPGRTTAAMEAWAQGWRDGFYGRAELSEGAEYLAGHKQGTTRGAEWWGPPG